RTEAKTKPGQSCFSNHFPQTFRASGHTAEPRPAIDCCLVTAPESGKTAERRFLPRRMTNFGPPRPAVQLISPACTMASRTAARAFSLAGTIGRRTFSEHLPISDIAYLTGAGLVSTNR